MAMQFMCYFNFIEQQMLDIQKIHRANLWQPWRDMSNNLCLERPFNLGIYHFFFKFSFTVYLLLFSL